MLLFAGLGVLLLGCLVTAGVGVYYFAGDSLFGTSIESRLVGDWDFYAQADPNNPTVLAPMGSKITFHKDHTYTQDMGFGPMTGRWTPESWDGKAARLRLEDAAGGTDIKFYLNLTFLDADRADFFDEISGGVGQLRRPGSASANRPAGAGGNQAATGQPAGPAGGPPIIWASQTINPGGLSLITPAALEKGATKAGSVSGLAVRWTDFKATSPPNVSVTEVRVRNYTINRAPKGGLGGRTAAEILGSAYLAAEGGVEAKPVRTFEKGSKKAAIYALRTGLYLAIGDDKTVAVIALLGANLTETDPIVKAIFDSVTFN